MSGRDKADVDTLWCVIRDTKFRLWVALLVVSLGLHLFGPLLSVAGLAFSFRDEPNHQEEDLDAIAVSIFDEVAPHEADPRPAPEDLSPPGPAPAPAPTEGASSAEGTPPPPAAQAAAKTPVPDKKPQSPLSELDGGLPPPKPVEVAAPQDAGTPPWPAQETAEAPTPWKGNDKPTASSAEEGVADSALTKVRGKNTVAKSNANVELVLFNAAIRAHPVGPRVGAILRRLPQWRSFFSAGAIDPIADLDTLHVSGPQFRDSSNVAVLIRHHLSDKAVKGSVDALVNNRAKRGQWLPNTPVPAALAWADRAERLFVLSRSNLVVIVPPKLQVQALKPQPLLPLEGGEGVAVVARVVTPKNVFNGSSLQLPRSFDTVKALTLHLVVLPDGGVNLTVRGDDVSPEQARLNARGISETLQGYAGLGAVAGTAERIFDLWQGKSERPKTVPLGLASALARAKVTSRDEKIFLELLLSKADVEVALQEIEQLLAAAGLL